MALVELWSSRHSDTNSQVAAEASTKQAGIQPGVKVWVKERKIEINDKIPPGKIQSKRAFPARIFKRPQAKAVKRDIKDRACLWHLAQVITRSGNTISVRLGSSISIVDLDRDEVPLAANQDVVEDMTELHHTHEAGILNNIRERAMRMQPYTYIGNVLVSVNPLRMVPEPDVDSDCLPAHPSSVAERAFQKMKFAATQRLRLLEIQQINERATECEAVPSGGSLINKESNFSKQFGLINQSIIISGESGSGKTEAAKRVLKRLVEREGYDDCYLSDIDEPEKFDFQDQLLGSAILLECLGNAKTKRNPNSSRYGSFMQLRYEPTVDDMEYKFFMYGASFTTYLLERSRVCWQEPGEKNFNVFYQLLTSPLPRLQKLLGFDKAGHKFKYLGNDFKKQDHDRKGYLKFRTTLQMVKLGCRNVHVFMIIAAVLHLGNIDFQNEITTEGAVAAIDNYIPSRKQSHDRQISTRQKSVNGPRSRLKTRRSSVRTFAFNSADRKMTARNRLTRNTRRTRRMTTGSARSGYTEISQTTYGTEKTRLIIPRGRAAGYSPVAEATRLLAVRPNSLAKMFTEKTVRIGAGEAITKRLTVAQAEQRRDAVAKHIYALFFDWVVDRLNITFQGNPEVTCEEDISCIGVLDVFGFESFQKNSFEQLLINYANEVLISLFAQEILIGESELYKEEGLIFEAGSLADTNEVAEVYGQCISLFEGKPQKGRFSPGLFAVIDSQLKVPDPSDEKLLRELNKTFKSHENFKTPHQTKKDKCFVISHYSNEVEYTIDHFLQKNDHSLPSDIYTVFKSSKHVIVHGFPRLTKKLTELNNDKKHVEPARGKKSSKSRNMRRKKSKAPTRMLRKVKPQKKVQKTVCGVFANQMNELKKSLLRTTCHYIRCVKPNPTLYSNFNRYGPGANLSSGDPRAKDVLKVTMKKIEAVKAQQNRRLSYMGIRRKKAEYFDQNYVSAQLRNLGVYECVNVLKAGLPTRIPYPSFISSFSKKISLNDIVFYQNRPLEFRQRVYVSALLNYHGIAQNTYKLGKTKIFFPTGELDNFQSILAQTDNNKRLRRRLKKSFRRFYCQRIIRVAIAKMQTIDIFTDALERIRAVRVIQHCVKRFIFLKVFSGKVLKRTSAVLIQKIWRGFDARRKYQQRKEVELKQELDNMFWEFRTDIGTEVGIESYKDTEASPDELESAFTSVPQENDAFEKNLENYFTRRTAVNRQTKALSKIYGDEKYKSFTEKRQTGVSSILSKLEDDNVWHEAEMAIYEIEGEDADPLLDPMERIDEDSDIQDDDYDEDEDDLDFSEDDDVQEEIDEFDEYTGDEYSEANYEAGHLGEESPDASGDIDFIPDNNDLGEVADLHLRTTTKTPSQFQEVPVMPPVIDNRQSDYPVQSQSKKSNGSELSAINRLNPNNSRTRNEKKADTVRTLPEFRKLQLRKVKRDVPSDGEESAGTQDTVADRVAKLWGTTLKRTKRPPL